MSEDGKAGALRRHGCLNRNPERVRDRRFVEEEFFDSRDMLQVKYETETCKMNGVEPYAWLKSTLEKIAAGHPQSRIRELLPWNFGPASR